MPEILDYNPLTGETVSFDYHEQDGTFTIGHFQDCTNVLEDNKRRVLMDDGKEQVKQGWLRYACIPNVIVLKWKREHGVDFFNEDHWPRVMALLNSREYRYLKATDLTHDR